MPRYTLTLDQNGRSRVIADRQPRRYRGFADTEAPEQTPEQIEAKARSTHSALSQQTSAAAGAQQTFKRDMMQAAIKVAAVQTGISIALMCVPIVGWALGIIYSVLQWFASKHVKRETTSIMNDLKVEIDQKNKQVQRQVHTEEDRIANELLPAAQALALSSAPLEGLGSLWTSVTGSVRTAAKQVSKAVVQVHKVPAKFAVDQTMKAAAGAARTVGAKGVAAQLDRDRAHVDHAVEIAATHAEKDLGDPKEMDAELRRVAGYVNGDEQIRAAKEGAAKVRAKVFAQLAAAKADTLAQMATDKYRQNLTLSMAKAIRGDPNMLNAARVYQKQEQDAALRAGLPASTVVATVPSSNIGTIATVGAALSAFFLLRH